MEIVNGYVCNNCTDVSAAKRNVDPAHPKDGPNGANAPGKAEDAKAERGPAVTFGGEAAKQQQAQQADQPREVEKVRQSPYVPGSTVTLRA